MRKSEIEPTNWVNRFRENLPEVKENYVNAGSDGSYEAKTGELANLANLRVRRERGMVPGLLVALKIESKL